MVLVRRPRGRAFVPVRKDTTRVNDQIRKSPVRFIDADGTQVGIIPLEEALRRAQDQSLDLVEVGADANPPVVKVMDWGKTRFEKEKRAKESKKRAAVIEVKEVKFRPTIGENDFQIKAKRAIRFLEKGKKVKITVFFRLRQLRRPELGEKILDNVSEMILESGAGEIEIRSRLEGRQMTMILNPLQDKLHK